MRIAALLTASAKKWWCEFGLEAEDFAGDVERADLAAAVGEKPVEAHRAEGDLVDRRGLLALAVDFGIGRIHHHLVRLALVERQQGACVEGRP